MFPVLSLNIQHIGLTSQLNSKFTFHSNFSGICISTIFFTNIYSELICKYMVIKTVPYDGFSCLGPFLFSLSSFLNVWNSDLESSMLREQTKLGSRKCTRTALNFSLTLLQTINYYMISECILESPEQEHQFYFFDLVFLIHTLLKKSFIYTLLKAIWKNELTKRLNLDVIINI